MIDRVNDLFCEENKFLSLFEYSHEIKLLKEFIVLADDYLKEYECLDVFTSEGVCSLFAKSVIQYAKSAYDNLLIGHFDTSYMMCRNIVESNVCLEVLIEYENEELWKYYLAYSFHHTWRMNPNSDYSKYLEKEFNEICSSLNVEKRFLTKRKVNGKILKPFIDENYGWTYKVNKKFSFSGLCQLVKTRRYKDFKLMSEFSHGTSIMPKMDDGNYIERALGIITSLYVELESVLMQYCPLVLSYDFYEVDDKLGELLLKRINYNEES